MSPCLGVCEEETEEWGLWHPSHLQTEQLYFSMSYKLGFTERFHFGKGCFVKKNKTKVREPQVQTIFTDTFPLNIL